MKDSKFTTNDGILNLHPTRGKHWVLHINENQFDSYGFPPPTMLKNHKNKRNGKCVFLMLITLKENIVFVLLLFYILIN